MPSIETLAKQLAHNGAVLACIRKKINSCYASHADLYLTFVHAHAYALMLLVATHLIALEQNGLSETRFDSIACIVSFG